MSSQNIFTHLHVHSQYSVLDGMAPVSKLVDKAIANGQNAMALTDHGNMYGMKEFFNYVNKINSGKSPEERFKPLLGCEMYVAPESMHNKRGKQDQKAYHLIVIAKNLNGYHNLIKLVSRAFTEGYYYRPRTEHKELEKYHEDLIVCSACLGGEIPQLIMQGELEKAEEAVRWFHDLFGDDFELDIEE